MRIIILFLGLLHSLYALSATSAIPEDQKQVVFRIMTGLDLPTNANTQELVYKKLNAFFTKNWSAHWITNTSGADSRIKNSNTKICDVIIYNDNRAVNCTFVYFKKEKQLFITLKQYIEDSSSLILKRYNEIKKDSKYTLQNETDNYAYFQEKGYMSYETYHVKSPVGMVIYEDTFFLDIK